MVSSISYDVHYLAEDILSHGLKAVNMLHENDGRVRKKKKNKYSQALVDSKFNKGQIDLVFVSTCQACNVTSEGKRCELSVNLVQTHPRLSGVDSINDLINAWL